MIVHRETLPHSINGGTIMAGKTFNKVFESPRMDSRITSANTQHSERALGFFIGPMLVYMVYYGVAGTYLTQFYTDVLQISGIFLVLMPVLSKIVDAFTNIFMGRIIDRTRTRQGKARPWILISGILLAIAGVMLYAVPRASYRVQIIWVVFSYNLFFALAFTIYNMSHLLMVPLSTRNSKQRDTLALLSNAGCSMIPGLLVTVIMPIVIAKLGVGDAARGSWLTMMSIISILAIPATLIEYYFTKERITEDAAVSENEETVHISFKEQMKACLADPYWLIVMGFWILYNLSQYLMSGSMIYYCNWVLGDSVESGAVNQVAVNMIGQAPLGLGAIILWPLVRKFGKRLVMMIGFGICAVGCLCVMLSGSNMALVLPMLAIRSAGMVPVYVITALLAEAMDHIEWKRGFRVDGFSASIYSIIITVCAGAAQSILLAGINGLGYIAPESVSQHIAQPDGMKFFFTFCFVGVTMIAYAAGSLMMLKFDVEDKMPQIQADLTERRRLEAEARGEVYVSPEEKAARELEEQERIAEEQRIIELRALCDKKGLSFEEEEAKYQTKLAEKRAKEEAKKAKADAKAAARKARSEAKKAEKK